MERLQRQNSDLGAQCMSPIVEAASFVVGLHVKGLVVTALDRNGMVVANLRLVDHRAVWQLTHRLPQALAEQEYRATVRAAD
jgi:hypothetical protein